MLSITTTYTDTPSGATKVVAKGHGRQRSIRLDPAHSPDQAHATACGALLNVLTTPEQRARVKHPSGGQRVRVEPLTEHGGKRRWTIDV